MIQVSLFLAKVRFDRARAWLGESNQSDTPFCSVFGQLVLSEPSLVVVKSYSKRPCDFRWFFRIF